MVQPKYSPQEALERVKLMMKYNSSKTLNENKSIIFEADKTEEEKIGDEIYQATNPNTMGTDEKGLISAIEKIKNPQQFWKINDYLKAIQLNNRGPFDFAGFINDEMDNEDGEYVNQIVNYLKKIGIDASAKVNDNGNFYQNSFVIKSTPLNVKTDDKKEKKQQQAPTIPPELKDIEGVKKFQDWLDTNKAGWATGFPDGKLKQAGGYGRYGPRTTKAWTSFGPEYLKGGDTPTVAVVTPGEQGVEDVNQA